MDLNGTARIAGLGSAYILGHATAQPETKVKEPCRRSAPELMHPEEFGLSYPHTTKASDIYAFGVLAWEVRVSTKFPKSLAGTNSLGFHGTPYLFR